MPSFRAEHSILKTHSIFIISSLAVRLTRLHLTVFASALGIQNIYRSIYYLYSHLVWACTTCETAFFRSLLIAHVPSRFCTNSSRTPRSSRTARLDFGRFTSRLFFPTPTTLRRYGYPFSWQCTACSARASCFIVAWWCQLRHSEWWCKQANCSHIISPCATDSPEACGYLCRFLPRPRRLDIHSCGGGSGERVFGQGSQRLHLR